jgi:hypothetical protein
MAWGQGRREGREAAAVLLTALGPDGDAIGNRVARFRRPVRGFVFAGGGITNAPLQDGGPRLSPTGGLTSSRMWSR